MAGHGIPPEEQPANHYKLLGIRPFETSAEVIDSAGGRQMSHLWTFQGGKHSELTQRLLNGVAVARVCLLDAKSRAAYDQQLRPDRSESEPKMKSLRNACGVCMYLLRYRVAISLFMLSAAVRLDAAVHVALLQTDVAQTSDVVAAVEAQLAASAKISLVERQQIVKILREQRLQAVLGADAVAGRVAMGKMFQADLLVFLQYAHAPVPHLNVIISETHLGLRIVRQSVNLQDQASAVDRLCKIVEQAIDKHSQEVSDIFAVPPFVSDDLGFKFDHLKGAYATLIEDFVYTQKGALVVEFAEARAIAKEIALVDGADVRRPLPLYILGRYRNDGAQEARRVRIELKLMRGDKEVASVTKADLAADHVAGVLREAATGFVSHGNAAPVAPADPRIEAGQLAERARLMKTFGSWRESLDLMEASFLLDPDQPALHLDAVEVLSKFICEPGVFTAGVPITNRPEGIQRIDTYRRGLEHLELYLRHTKLDRKQRHGADVVSLFVVALDRWGTGLFEQKFLRGEVDPLWPDFFAARHASTEMFYRVLAAKSKNHVVDDALGYLSLFDDWGARIYFAEPQGSTWFDGIDRSLKRDKHLALLADFAYLPEEGYYLEFLIDFPGIVEPNSPAIPLAAGYREFLLKARAIPNPGLRKKADELLAAIEPLRQRLEAEKKQVAAIVPTDKERARKPDPTDDVFLSKLTLNVEGAHSRGDLLPIDGFLPVGKGLDFVWNQHGTFLMKRPGVLRQIDPRDLNGGANRLGWVGADPKFDGRFVWCVVGDRQHNDQTRKLFIIDPGQERVHEIGLDQGLPACTALEVAPLGPGKAIIVGYFGQTFVATVDFKPPTAAKIKIIHDFRKVPKLNDDQQWHDTSFIFRPGQLFTLRETSPNGNTKQGALVWRMSEEWGLIQHPLLVDIATGDVRALEERFFCYYPTQMTTSGGACYQFDKVLGPDVIRRISVSKVTTRPAEASFHNIYQVFEADGLLNVIDDDNRGGWCISALDRGPMHRLKITMPPSISGMHVDQTENYGLVARVNQRKDQSHDEDYNIYQVKFAKPLSDLLPKDEPVHRP